jgi:hypothetical protein
MTGGCSGAARFWAADTAAQYRAAVLAIIIRVVAI